MVVGSRGVHGTLALTGSLVTLGTLGGNGSLICCGTLRSNRFAPHRSEHYTSWLALMHRRPPPRLALSRQSVLLQVTDRSVRLARSAHKASSVVLAHSLGPGSL